MALVVCGECGKKVSDKAKACPGCGCPLDIILTTEKHQLNSQENGCYAIKEHSDENDSNELNPDWVRWEKVDGKEQIGKIKTGEVLQVKKDNDEVKYVNPFSGSDHANKNEQGKLQYKQSFGSEVMTFIGILCFSIFVIGVFVYFLRSLHALIGTLGMAIIYIFAKTMSKNNN